MADESLREIQLNGKQLVFLFMTVTVVAVVIFLCGVMVGRGVRAPQPSDPEVATDVTVDPTASPSTSTVGTTATTASPATSETLTYPDRLEGDQPPPESLEDVDDPTAPTVRPSETRSTKGAVQPAARDKSTASAAPAKPAAAAATSEPAGSGFVVQVAATKERGEADTIARRLVGKGYPAFVTTPPSGPQMFRVRVGKYQDRKEADRIAGRLQREEQFKPWVTR
jgi:cell division septation protein DedD